MVKNINPTNTTYGGSYPQKFATLDGNLFFIATDGSKMQFGRVMELNLELLC